VSLCKVLEDKTLFGALNGVYSLTIIDFKAVLQRGGAKRAHTLPLLAPILLLPTLLQLLLIPLVLLLRPPRMRASFPTKKGEIRQTLLERVGPTPVRSRAKPSGRGQKQDNRL
jgi:hypothetical protein